MNLEEMITKTRRLGGKSNKGFNDTIKNEFPADKLMGLVDNEFADVSLVRNAKGKVSAKLSMNGITDIDTRRMLMFVAEFPSRAALYHGEKSLGVYTPLFMAAHKKHHGIAYSEWSMESADEPKYALGFVLYDIVKQARFAIKKELIPTEKSALLAHRRSCLTNGKINDETRWGIGTAKFLKRGDGIDRANFISYMMLQLWIASPPTRSELMILDPKNFDNMPDALETDIEAIAAGDDIGYMPL